MLTANPARDYEIVDLGVSPCFSRNLDELELRGVSRTILGLKLGRGLHEIFRIPPLAEKVGLYI